MIPLQIIDTGLYTTFKDVSTTLNIEMFQGVHSILKLPTLTPATLGSSSPATPTPVSSTMPSRTCKTLLFSLFSSLLQKSRVKLRQAIVVSHILESPTKHMSTDLWLVFRKKGFLGAVLVEVGRLLLR
jgi:hypothetical protein